LLTSWDTDGKKWVKKQRKEARKGRKKLAESIHRHQKRLLRELNILSKFSQLVSDEKSDEFANRLWEETLICLQFEWEDSGLHKLRKHLKHLLYTLHWWDYSHKRHIPGFTKTELSALEKAIGQWHDKMEMLDNMLISGKNHTKLPQIQIIDLCIAHCHAELEIVHKQLKAFRYLYIPELI
jgi:CHAD domain-containing protein